MGYKNIADKRIRMNGLQNNRKSGGGGGYLPFPLEVLNLTLMQFGLIKNWQTSPGCAACPSKRLSCANTADIHPISVCGSSKTRCRPIGSRTLNASGRPKNKA